MSTLGTCFFFMVGVQSATVFQSGKRSNRQIFHNIAKISFTTVTVMRLCTDAGRPVDHTNDLPYVLHIVRASLIWCKKNSRKYHPTAFLKKEINAQCFLVAPKKSPRWLGLGCGWISLAMPSRANTHERTSQNSRLGVLTDRLHASC